MVLCADLAGTADAKDLYITLAHVRSSSMYILEIGAVHCGWWPACVFAAIAIKPSVLHAWLRNPTFISHPHGAANTASRYRTIDGGAEPYCTLSHSPKLAHSAMRLQPCSRGCRTHPTGRGVMSSSCSRSSSISSCNPTETSVLFLPTTPLVIPCSIGSILPVAETGRS